MPKRSGKRTKRLPDHGLDTVQNARRVVDEALNRVEATPEPPVSQATVSQVMAAMGRKGGQIGGRHRMDAMTVSERKALGRLAARARWGKKKKKPAA